MADRELQVLKNALREHVNALAVDIGPRTPSMPDSLVRTANYIHSVFEDAGLSVREQGYQYYDQPVTNILATSPADHQGLGLLRRRRSLRYSSDHTGRR